MKLKLDENQNVVLKDGMPVYQHEDGSESPFNAKSAMDKIHELNEESKNRRLKIDELNKKINDFEGIDVSKAKKALETIKNLDDKQLVDANEIEKLKQSISEAHEANLKDIKKSYSEEKDKLTKEIENLQNRTRQLMISNQFSVSQFVKDKLTIPPDMTENFFGHLFQIEEANGQLKVVPYDQNGNKILSHKTPGEIADFEEALPRIVEKYPRKDFILKGGKSGSGATGNTGLGSDGKVTPSEVRDMSLDAYEQAKKEGRILKRN